MMHNLPEWLEALEALVPSKIELGLERIQAVAEKGHLNQFACPVITVAGTNGKGSTVRGITQRLTEMGFKVGAYYSPHLFSFTERIHIENQPIDETKLCQSFQAIKQLQEERTLSYFEFTTLAALHAFQQVPLDVVVLEVGLGGRLDAVNCVSPDIAIVTAIDYDHCDWLGETLEDIAREKAGIFRKGIPVLLGREAILSSLMEIAAHLDVQLYRSGVDFYWKDSLQQEWQFQGQDLARTIKSAFSESDLLAMGAIKVLQAQFPMFRENVLVASDLAPTMVHMPGRFFKIEGAVTRLFDVAHNPHGAKWLAEKLCELNCEGRIWAVWSSFQDKDLCNIVKPLIPFVTGWYLGELNSTRKASLAMLEGALNHFQVTPCFASQDLKQSYHAALQHAEPGDWVLVFGSFETVGMLLAVENSLN